MRADVYLTTNGYAPSRGRARLMIESGCVTVDGETVDEAAHQWWCVTQSGGEVNYGVDSLPIADGDHFEFQILVW